MKTYRFNFSILLFAIILLSSCKKDSQKLIVGTWDIESVTFNGEEQRDNPLLLGIVKYQASYDPDWKETWDGSYGSMVAMNKNDSTISYIYVSFPPEKPDTMHCGENPNGEQISGSFLPGMIDSVLGASLTDPKEYWRVLELTRRKLSIQLIYLGNIYEVQMKKE